ncbi:MAG: Lrp/AsnC family transcriptional regulator [Christensenellaceae bacterium]|nr:Lrp/AsnC family transcriptional regulator [Christensenellaceae bacterium]
MVSLIDRIDREILRYLQQDASISNLELSRLVGLSPSACLARTKSLKESGVIRQSTILVDEERVGIGTIAFALVNLAPFNRTNSQEFLSYIEKFPQIQECYTLTGSHDYLLKIVAANMGEYRDFIIDKLLGYPYISKIETNMVMGIDKRTPCLPIPDGE